jgi:flagellar biosynthesis/type III secretory pathway protein FliH
MKAETFKGESFDAPSKGPSGHFQEFYDPKIAANAQTGPKFDPQIPEPGAKPLREGPSLGYLFEPFDQGAPKNAVNFDALKPPDTEIFEFQDLNLKDVNIINTLEKAKKRAKIMVLAAREKEKAILAEVEAKGEALAQELAAKAQSAAEVIKEAATKEAEAIKETAKIQIADAAKAHEELEAIKAEMAKVNEAMADHKAKIEEREKVLNAQDTELKASKAALAAAKEAFEVEKRRTLEEITQKGLAEGQKTGLAQGQAQGLALGEAKGREEALAKVQTLLKALDRFNDLYPELWAANGAMMVELAVEAAEAIVKKEVENGRGLAAGAFKAALEHLRQSHEAVFRINPGDLAELEAARAEYRGEVAGLVNISFVPDPALGPGDLVMEADVGRLDATIKNRTDMVMSVLRESLAQGRLAPIPGPPASNPIAPEAAQEPAENPGASGPQPGGTAPPTAPPTAPATPPPTA